MSLEGVKLTYSSRKIQVIEPENSEETLSSPRRATRRFRVPSGLRLTAPTDGAAMVGLVGGVDTVGGRTVGNAAVHLSVGLTAATLAPRQLHTETPRLA